MSTASSPPSFGVVVPVCSIASHDGHVVTNYHVVENHTRIQATLFRKTDKGFDKVELRAVPQPPTRMPAQTAARPSRFVPPT